ncbi:MAG: hypothetical protein NVS9B1_12690 [Candidatus Dormibacteraceae bacterium]
MSGSEGPTAAEFAGLGGMLAGAVIIPLLIGWAVDSAAHTGPLFLLIGLGVGILAAIFTAYTRFKRYL